MQLHGLSGFSAWLVYNKIVFNLVFVRRFNAVQTEQAVLIEKLKLCESVEQYKDVAAQLTSDRFKKVYYSHAEALEIFKQSPPEGRKALLAECLVYTDLSDDEVLRLLKLHTDENGVPLSKVNVNNLDLNRVNELIMETLIACSEVQTDFSLMTEEEIKLSEKYKVNINDEANELLSKAPQMETGNLISTALKRIFARLKRYDNAKR